jgi:proline utilization trans-activator
MGMHRDGSNREFDPIERNTRRQVWWSIYVHEKKLCSVLGRPTVIDDREMTTRLPDASMLEQQSMSSEYLGYALELAQMSYRIRQQAYFDERTAEERSPTVHVAANLLRDCDEFYSRMPRCLSLDFSSQHPPRQRANILLLHLYYYYTRCIVSRDFLIKKVERDISFLENKLPPISEDWDTTFALGENCVESAHQSIRCIMAGLELGLFGYSWLDLFFVFHSVLIVCADFLARPETQQNSRKDTERKEMVRAMLDHVRGMKKLAPTYSILGRIAMQFAGLTGVYYERDSSEGLPNQTLEPSPNPRLVAGHDSGLTSLAGTDFEDDWFASATTNLGLDFCDLSQAASAAEMPGHPGDLAYPIQIQPIVSQVEDWTDRSLRGMHSL